MLKTRVIPVMLIQDGYFVKTTKFKNPEYVGDPLNIVKIFSDKEADEITIYDIGSLVTKDNINYKLIENIASSAIISLYGTWRERCHASRLGRYYSQSHSCSTTFFCCFCIKGFIARSFDGGRYHLDSLSRFWTSFGVLGMDVGDVLFRKLLSAVSW